MHKLTILLIPIGLVLKIVLIMLNIRHPERLIEKEKHKAYFSFKYFPNILIAIAL